MSDLFTNIFGTVGGLARILVEQLVNRHKGIAQHRERSFVFFARIVIVSFPNH